MLKLVILPSRRLRRTPASKLRIADLKKRYTATTTAKSPIAMPTSTRNQEHEYGRLFEFQAKLPKLPVPDLHSTVQKYVESLEAVLPHDKFLESKQVAEAFAASTQGQDLQRRLMDRANEPGRANWLEEWWNDLSYMGYRDPVIPYVSYHYSYNDDPAATTASQRAARVAVAALAFRSQIVDGSLEPEMQKTSPLCSHSYKYMFNACRIPHKPSDFCRTVDYMANETITVIRNNQFFAVPVTYQGVPLNTAEFAGLFERIIETADSLSAVPVGVLTADNRDSWADNRQLLLGVPGNAEVLDAIESSAFVVILDKTQPVTREELSHAIWHGDGRSRWFDKPVQFTVTDNARAGLCGEHSMMDGTPTLRLSDYVIAYQHQPAQKVRPGLDFSQLTFHTPPKVVAAVKRAGEFFDTGIAKQHIAVLNYNAYGKEVIKTLKCSPDAYVQMVIQLAYSRLHGCVRPTYESSMTRKFLHGRTETCRSVSNDSAAWCRAMASSKTTRAERIELFRKAAATHTQLTREAIEGKGVDRHLLGLRMVLQPGEEKPRIFEDPAYAYSSHWYLSTSQISSEGFASYGWSEVTPKGYGIAYNIKRDSLMMHIACMRNEFGLNSDHLAHYLEQAANDVRDLLSQQQQ